MVVTVNDRVRKIGSSEECVGYARIPLTDMSTGDVTRDWFPLLSGTPYATPGGGGGGSRGASISQARSARLHGGRGRVYVEVKFNGLYGAGSLDANEPGKGLGVDVHHGLGLGSSSQLGLLGLGLAGPGTAPVPR